MPKNVLMLLPDADYDPSEAGIPWATVTAAGHAITFATPSGLVAEADRRLTDLGFGMLSPLLMAKPDARARYREMSASAPFSRPLRIDRIGADDFDALLIPGGHASGMKTLLEHGPAYQLVAGAFRRRIPVAAICHGVVLVARSRDADTGRSVLHGYRTTALPKHFEWLAWRLTRRRLGDYYRTYPTWVEDEVRAALATPSDFDRGPKLPLNTPLNRSIAGFFVRDRHYLSGRWPGDCYRFARELAGMLA